MTPFKPGRRHLTIHGHPFHFASYKGRSANRRRAQLAYPAMWYLMVDGRRCPVLPCDSCPSALELDAALRDYAEDNAMGPFGAGHPQHHSPLRLAATAGGHCRLRTQEDTIAAGGLDGWLRST